MKRILAMLLALALSLGLALLVLAEEEQPESISVKFTLIDRPKKINTDEILLEATVDDLVVGSTVSEVFQKALAQAGYICTLDETGWIDTIADPNGAVVFPFERTNVNGISEALMGCLVNGGFVEPDAVVEDGDKVIVRFMELIVDPPFCPGKFVGLFGKYTDYPSNFWNWFKFVALFGWVWMWFVSQ